MTMQQNPSETRTDTMGRDYERLFQAIPRMTAPSYLCERVLGAIERERILRKQATLVVSSLSCAISALGLVLAVRAFLAAASASGFTSFASLATSDSSLIAGHFSTFTLSLLESLPTLETTAVLFVIAVFLVSLKSLVGSFPRLSFFSRLTTS